MDKDKRESILFRMKTDNLNFHDAKREVEKDYIRACKKGAEYGKLLNSQKTIYTDENYLDFVDDDDDDWLMNVLKKV